MSTYFVTLSDYVLRLLYHFAMVTFFLGSCTARVRITNVSTTGIELQVNSKTPKELISCWIQLHEKDSASIRQFRPCTDTLPPLRFRNNIQFHKNGKYIEQTAGVDDRPITWEGNWVYGAKSNTLDISFKKIEVGLIPLAVDQKKPYVLKILHLSDTLLIVSQQNP